MLKSFVGRCLAVILLSLPACGFAGPFSNVYVLGDSLSDQGNLLLATGGIPGVPALPDPLHYFAGRFSNGPVYTDLLAQGLGLTLRPSLLGGTNFAYGGARTAYNTVESTQPGGFLPPGQFPWSLNAEITDFRARNIHDPGALYVVFSGSNDIADMVRGINATAIPTTLAAVLDAIDAFRDAGARTILVPNLPDLGLTPLFRLNPNPLAAVAATTFSSTYNAVLHDALDAISGVNIVEFDTFTAVRNIVANPGAFELSDVTRPCYSGFVAPNPTATECPDPDEHFFWDVVHPTRVVHRILAGQLLASGLPLPSTLPLLLLGLLALGGVKLRRLMRSQADLRSQV